MDQDQIVKSRILEILENHRGEKNRIPRSVLLHKLNTRFDLDLNDRQMRAHLEELRLDHERGCWICSSLKGGYYLANDPQELRGSLASDRHRALNTLKRIGRQERKAGLQASTQLELPL